ncbi:MAG TPA: hypothetical protein VNQ77_07820 [Frankiaceae bacterium]|nr:hypothetical protein [Frankiaceae bacterium]
MRTTRLAVPVAVLLAASGLNAASAAARKPVCLQVVDASGDGMVAADQTSEALDILSGDIATGKRNLVAAMRLTTVERDQFQTTGVTYVWTWSVGGVTQRLAYYVYVGGTTSASFDPNTAAGASGDEVNVSAFADGATKTITWTVARKLLGPVKKGAKFSAFKLTTHLGLNQRLSGEGRSQVSVADTAQSGKSYVDGTITCLKGT